jgi:hypothetical protein
VWTTVGAVLIGAVEGVLTGGAAVAAGALIYQASHVATVEEVRTNCRLLSTSSEPSTRRGNRNGGTSVVERYVCPDGTAYEIHTVYDANGNVLLEPHIRVLSTLGLPGQGRPRP